MPKSNLQTTKNPKKIYMDYAASVLPNPSSIHIYGVEAKAELERARKFVAGVLGARPEEIIFTSGGTESNNLAILGIVYAATEENFVRSSDPRVPIPARPLKNSLPLPHVVTTNIEHPSVLETCKILEKRKLASVTYVPVEPNGIVDPKKIKKALKKNTVLVSVMYANNEIGTIQPIREIAKEIRHFNKTRTSPLEPRTLFHTDAVQAANYLDLNVEKLGVDMLSLSGTKIEGSGRVGVLYKKKNVKLSPVFGGGDQEGGIRPGTENLPEIIKFAEALDVVQRIKDKENKRLTTLRDYFLNQLRNSHVLKNVGMSLNGDEVNRLANNVNITFSKIPSDLLVIELSAKGIMASSKSACKSSRAEGSYVIKAINPNIDPEIGGVRFSLGRATTKSDIDYTIKALSQILTKLEKWY